MEDISPPEKYHWILGTSRGKRFLDSIRKYFLKISKIPVLIRVTRTNKRIFVEAFTDGPISVKFVTTPVLRNETPELELLAEEFTKELTPETHKRLLKRKPICEDEIIFRTIKMHKAREDRIKARRELFRMVEDVVEPAMKKIRETQ